MTDSSSSAASLFKRCNRRGQAGKKVHEELDCGPLSRTRTARKEKGYRNHERDWMRDLVDLEAPTASSQWLGIVS